MPITYHIDSVARLLSVVAEGKLEQEERLNMIRTWISDPAYEPGLKTLYDVSACTSTPTLQELRQIIAFVQVNVATIGRKKLAVVTGAPILFGVARQFQALADSSPLEVRVFADRAGAQLWLAEGNG